MDTNFSNPSLLLAGVCANEGVRELQKRLELQKISVLLLKQEFAHTMATCFLPIMVNIEGGTQVAAVEA